MQPPIVGHTVLGWDPAFRTGCKLAVVDPTGKVVDTTVIYPTAPTTPQKIQAAKDTLKNSLQNIISASFPLETEQLHASPR